MNDYIKNGIKYCSVCNAPKEYKTNSDIIGTVNVLCLCEQKKADEEKKRIENINRITNIRQMRNRCFPYNTMKNYTFEADRYPQSDTSKICREYVDKFDFHAKSNEGNGLLLFGGVGRGKTFYACCVANALIDKGFSCKFLTFSQIARELAEDYNGQNEYYKQLNRYKLLILDDWFSERKNTLMNEVIFSVIDNRCQAGLPTIVTSNITEGEIKNPSDIATERVVSRLLKMTVPVKVSGNDRRLEGALKR